MMWFFAVLVVAVRGVAATAATGRLGGLGETYDDRPDSLVPADRPLTAEDLEAVRFTSALRGYRMDEVDALLDRLAEELRAARGDGIPHGRPADEPELEPGER
jgi:DivIVA domain-containing protein